MDDVTSLNDAVRMLGKNWWLVALRGLFALIFGVLALAWPAITLLVLVIFFGAYSLVDGVTGVIRGIAARKCMPRWWLVVLNGLLGVAVGIVTFAWPGITALVLLVLIGAWAIALGILEIWAGVEGRKVIRDHWWVIISGVLGVLFGVLLLALPVAGALAIVWLIGVFAILEGIVFIWAGLKLRAAIRNLGNTASAAPAV